MLSASFTDIHKLPRWAACLIAVALTLATLALRAQIGVFFSQRPLLIMFMPPIICSAFLGGWLPGVVSTAVAALGTAYFFIPSNQGMRIAEANDLLQWLILIASGLLVSALCEMLHRFARGLRAEKEALRQREQRFTLAMDASKDGIWDWNVATGEVYYSPGYSAMLGYLTHELPPQADSWADLIHPEDKQAALAANMDCIENRRDDFEVEFRMRTADRGWRWILGRGKAVARDKSGRAERLVGTHTDITARKRAEAQFIEMKEAAEAANRAKSEFLANMSHEIRTPLGGVLGMLQILLTTCAEDKQREYIHTAIACSRQLTGLLGDILDLSRIEAGRLIIREEAFAVSDLGQAAREMFSLPAKQKGLGLTTETDERLPPRLLGDAARLRQILFNLTGNALKFTERGSVAIALSLASRPGETPVRLALTVTDTGIGIPEDRQEAIFDPFIQADGSSARAYQGVGLGLAIVRRLVTLMGGEIALTSRLGQGTSVRVVLPFGVAPEDAPGAGQALPDAAAPVRAFPDRKLRLLLVEDEAVNQLSMKLLMQEEGHDVALARDGRQALERLAEEDFDLILMDIQMPVMDGLEAAGIIRASAEFGAKSRIPIIALTAHAMDGDEQRFLDAGMDGYVSKPVELFELKLAMAKAIAAKDAETGAAD